MSSIIHSPIEHKLHRSSRNHKHHDSDFLAHLPDNILELKDQEKPGKGSDEDSLYERLIVAPFIMVSFLLSLCVVSRQERAWRVAQHDNGPGSWLVKWFHSEPYQEPADSTWQRTSADTSDTTELHGNVPNSAVDKETWHTNQKHREMAKLSLREAFALQHTVEAWLIIWAIIAFLGIVWASWTLLDAFG